ncbi:MAG: iron-containing alcohol dehydrogenase, partial [Pseudonocardiaceae bacterium]|nr:iron-containing alcohol dehydrogenase [Pseudonocardiaceae bacterium]
FRFTFPTDPARHLRAAELIDPGAVRQADPRDQLSHVLSSLMRDIGIPNGIGAVGYRAADIDQLVDGTMKQQRLLNVAPRQVGPRDIATVLGESLSNW